MADPRDLIRGEVGWETKEWGAEWDPGVRWANEDGMVLDYRDWDDESTRVVSGPYGPAWYSRFPGRRFPSRTLARQFWGVRARIVEEYRVPGRWIFRIKKG